MSPKFSPQHHMDVCMTLLFKKHCFNWLNKVLTADEKWCLYLNVICKWSWTDKGATAQLHTNLDLNQKKFTVLCNQCINAQQLQHVASAIAQKCQELTDVMFLHHNTQPDVAKLTYHLLRVLQALNFTRVSMTYPVSGSRWSKIMLIILMQGFPNGSVCIIGAAKEDCRWGRMI